MNNLFQNTKDRVTFTDFRDHLLQPEIGLSYVRSSVTVLLIQPPRDLALYKGPCQSFIKGT